MWVFSSPISHGQVGHWAMNASVDTHFGRTVWPFLVSTATSSVHRFTDAFWQWYLLEIRGKVVHGLHGYTVWPGVSQGMSFLLSMVSHHPTLIGEVSGALINNCFLLIQDWVTVVSWGLKRTGPTDRESEQSSWRAASWMHEGKYPEGKETNIWRKIWEIWVGWGGREKERPAVLQLRRYFCLFSYLYNSFCHRVRVPG